MGDVSTNGISCLQISFPLGRSSIADLYRVDSDRTGWPKTLKCPAVSERLMLPASLFDSCPGLFVLGDVGGDPVDDVLLQATREL